MELTKANYDVLNGCFLFRSLPEEQKDKVFGELRLREFEKGGMIYTRQHFANSLGIILRGEAAVLKENGALLNLLQPGACFGAAALFAPAVEYVTEIRAEKSCTAAFISDRELSGLFCRFPDMALDYIAFLSGRIQFLNRKIDSFTSPSAEDAVRSWLNAAADENGSIDVSGGFSRLARQLNIGRASLYRSLEKLCREGKIEKNGAHIQICRPD